MAPQPGFVPLGRLPQKGEAVWFDDGGWSSAIVVHTPREGKAVVSAVNGLPISSHTTHDLTVTTFYKPSA